MARILNPAEPAAGEKDERVERVQVVMFTGGLDAGLSLSGTTLVDQPAQFVIKFPRHGWEVTSEQRIKVHPGYHSVIRQWCGASQQYWTHMARV